MNTTLPASTPAQEIWKYLASDYLEIKCGLSRQEQDPLFREMKKFPVGSESIEIYRGFSAKTRLVVICGDSAIEECWLYFPRERKIRKFQLAPDRPLRL